MQHVFVIHGGTSVYEKYEDFLEQLRLKPIQIERYKSFRDWKSRLQDTLGPEYEVVSPGMPNKDSARYAEWKIWFERFIPFMQDGVVLVGHSLGGIFLAKYLAEHDIPKKISATFIVAAPHESGGSSRWTRKMGEFALPASLEKFAKQGGDIHLYHSKDDQVVSFDELEKYQAALPTAAVHTFEDRGHFNLEEFPELVADIKNLHG